MSVTPQDQDSLATCRNCGGTAPRRGAGGMPVGWYGLTVAVPEWYLQEGVKNAYQWVGQFCKAACLLAYGPEIGRMEELARQAYDPVVPDLPVRNPVGRRGPRP